MEKNYSLVDVEKATKIREKYLKAIEEENFEILPGEIYTKGFIKTYAKFLKIENDPAIVNFLNEKFSTNSPLIENSLEKVPSKITVPSKKKFKYILLGIFTVVLLMWGIYNIYSVYIINKSTALVNPPESIEQNLSTNEENNNQNTKPLEPTRPQNIKLTLEVVDKTIEKDACWIQVFVDDTLTFEGVIYEGEEKQFTGKESINLTLGNAGVVNLKLGEKDLGTLGELNKVVREVFTLEDLE